jgi:ubiquinone/menaquinone biosynthesis C-methylase UbiE
MRESRKKKDIVITGGMAKWYDKSSRARLGEFSEVADRISETAKPGAKILEIAPGPGYLSIELARRGFDVTGVELSADFVEIEKQNSAAAKVTVDFKQGNASALPLPDAGFDFTVCSAAFKNFSEPQKALDEMYRVLKTGGVALVIDMNREATDADIEEEMQRMPNLNLIDRIFIKLSFKTMLRNGAYNEREFEEFISRTAFPKHEILKGGIGFSVWLYK